MRKKPLKKIMNCKLFSRIALILAFCLISTLSGPQTAMAAGSTAALSSNNSKYYYYGSSMGTYTAKVSSGYLALRNAMAYDTSNEIGKIYNGESVIVYSHSSDSYWYVYAPKLGRFGYVDCRYLTAAGTNASCNFGTFTVKVNSGYLALRNAMAYDSGNEIGSLYSGETVQVIALSSKDYWYVYSTKLGKYGYVNSAYLYGNNITSNYGTYTAKVSSGYLALRKAASSDSSVEIGKIYTGEAVQVIDKNNSQFWYVYSMTLGKYGYVNSNYLVGSGASFTACYPVYTAKVSSGYLALRNAAAYDSANEIGKLNTGDTVQVIERASGNYWYVYSSKLGKYGYVDSRYLY